MSDYPMLTGVDDARVAKVGGKAAILEEIVRRWPQANVPPFRVFADGVPWISSLDFEGRVFRASSELDLFGGCGLHNTFFGVTNYNYSSIVPKILKPSDMEQSRLKMFAASVGKKYTPPTVISQKEGKPTYWAVVMQHPNNPGTFIVTYSDGPSAESKDSTLAMFSRSEHSIRQNQIVPDRETHAAFCDGNVNLIGDRNSADKDVAELAVINYITIRDLNIVHPVWVSILEAGIYHDGTETYQFTPIRRRTPGSHEVAGNKLIFGACEPVKLPVVKLPSHTELEYYVRNSKGLENYSDFEEFIRETVATHGQFLIDFNLVPGLSWRYMQKVEERYPEGYLAIAPLDKYQEFDIPMTKAKAVLIDTTRPLLALNHSTSRLMHKAPVLVVDDMDTLRLNLATGNEVTFSCDGSNYSITS